MKIAIQVMVGFFFLSFYILPIAFDFMFGPDFSGLYPIYSGMILLSGVLVICTRIILAAIKQQYKNQQESNSS